MNNRDQFCATCGRKRKPLEQRRESWGMSSPTVMLPRHETEGRAWQQFNDLIVNACVYRNGGTCEECHLRDECLRIGLRAIKLEVDRMLDVVEAGADKEAELARLTQELGHLQCSFGILQTDHDRMQQRLRSLLALTDPNERKAGEVFELARFEAARRPAR